MMRTSGMSTYSTFGKRIGLVGIANTLTTLKSLIILPIITKLLGASEYGIWSIIIVTITLMQPIILLGLDSSMLRFLSSKKKEEIVQGLITISIVVFVFGSLASLFLYLVSTSIGEFFFEKNMSSLFVIALPLIVLNGLNTIALGSFRIFGLIKNYFYIKLIDTLLAISLLLIFVFLGFGLIGALASLLLTNLLTLIVMLIIIFSYSGISRPNFSILGPYLKYGIPMAPSAVFQIIVSSSDRYVIGFFMSTDKVGIYSAAYGIGSIVLMFSSYILYILRPTIYNLYDNKKLEDVKKYLTISWKYFLLFSIPSTFGLYILAKPLLLSLTTSEFVSEGRLVIPIVALSMIFYGMEMIFGCIVLLEKRSSILAIMFGITAALNLGLNIVIVPRWGILGASITTLVAYLIAVLSMGLISTRYVRLDIQVKFIAKSICASIVISFVLWILNPIGTLAIVLSIGLSAIIYLLILFLLGAFSKKELRTLAEIAGLSRFFKW